MAIGIDFLRQNEKSASAADVVMIGNGFFYSFNA